MNELIVTFKTVGGVNVITTMNQIQIHCIDSDAIMVYLNGNKFGERIDTKLTYQQILKKLQHALINNKREVNWANQDRQFEPVSLN